MLSIHPLLLNEFLLSFCCQTLAIFSPVVIYSLFTLPTYPRLGEYLAEFQPSWGFELFSSGFTLVWWFHRTSHRVKLSAGCMLAVNLKLRIYTNIFFWSSKFYVKWDTQRNLKTLNFDCLSLVQLSIFNFIYCTLWKCKTHKKCNNIKPTSIMSWLLTTAWSQ